MRTMPFLQSITAIAIALLLAPGLAAAQRYPSKPIRLVVPYAAGGPSDVLARSAAQRIAAGIGGTVVVENRPGAGTIPGAETVAKSEPDGHTLFLTTATAVSINQHMFKTLPYSPEKDFVPVGMLALGPYGAARTHERIALGHGSRVIDMDRNGQDTRELAGMAQSVLKEQV